jgi:hypothetical protein
MRHVNPGWKETHFLSFTECKARAEYYGSSYKNYIPYFGQPDWDFLLLTISFKNLSSLVVNEIFKGVYFIKYKTNVAGFNGLGKILLLDLVSYFNELLRINISISQAHMDNAERDKEWLILPVNDFDIDEFSCKIAADFLSDIEYFVIDD